MLSYPVALEISYSDDISYRKNIRNLFSMTHICTWKKDVVVQVDQISIDECDYDELPASLFLDFVYDRTSSNFVFMDIYKSAAALMLSEDTSTGLAVLFSYTYFQLFHKCLVVFFTDPLCDLLQNIHFINLLEMFPKK